VITLDIRTIVFSATVINIVCTLIILALWNQSRKRYAGTGFLILDFSFQTTGLIMVFLRGSIPDWMSIVLSNTIVITGVILGYIGLERFFGKKRSQVHNCVLLLAFACIQAYYAFIQPNLAARNLNISVSLLILCFQFIWFLLRVVPQDIRQLTSGLVMIFSAYGIVSIIRIAYILTNGHPENDFFRSNPFDSLIFASYQILFILLTYSLILMYNKRLLMDVEAQEEKFFKAFHSSPYAMTISRLQDGKIIEVNKRFLNNSGFQLNEIMEKTALDLHLWEKEEDRAIVINELIQNGRVHEMEFRFRKKSGEMITGLFSAEIISTKNQKCVLTSIDDITKRKQAEEALKQAHDELEQRVATRTKELMQANETLKAEIIHRKEAEAELIESERRYKTITESAQDSIFCKNLNRQYTFVNPAMSKLLNCKEEDLIGKTPEQIFGSKFADVIKDVDDRTFTGKKVNEIRSLEINGTEYVFHTIQVPLEQRDGKVYSISGIVRDITEYVKTQEEKIKIENQLLQIQKMEAIGTLAGGMAHEFNNLLAVIMGNAEFLMNAASPEDKKVLDDIYESTQRGKRLVQQLLAFSRKSESRLSPILLNIEIQKIITMLGRLIQRKITLSAEASNDLWGVNADMGKIEQVLINLCLNARDAMPDGGNLTIMAKNIIIDQSIQNEYPNIEKGRYVQLSVSDTGHGMDKKTRECIFDPFFTTKGVGKGTGLGLAVVYGIITAHSGYIFCKSEPGLGTTFEIFLPAIEYAEIAGMERKKAFEPTKGKETILTVDDEDGVIRILQRMLNQLGYNTIPANSGEKALEIYKEKQEEIDLVILDLGMPGMGGHKCLTKLVGLDPNVKVIIASGYSAEGLIKDTIKQGALGYVVKPFTRDEISKIIREVLDVKRP
jgi:two-component system, cell cycle sensor histidine kinase and response regulator CckA